MSDENPQDPISYSAGPVPNPLDWQQFDGNDDHIDALENAVITYHELHQWLAVLVKDHRLIQLGDPTSPEHATLLEHLAACDALGVSP